MRFRFDRFEVDVAGHQLLDNETPVAIQPKALELLILLLENRDRSVTKDEIFSRLWGDRAVGDAALSRCVYLARKALQDDGHRFIQTQYGRGHRFSPDVEVVVLGPGAGAGASADTDTHTDTAGPPPHRRRLRLGRRWALGLAALPPLILLAWWLPQWIARRGPTAEPAGAGHRTVAILPATLPQSEPDSQLVLEALSDSLARSLARYGWSVLEPQWVEEVAFIAPSLEEVGARTGASLLVSWNLAPAAEVDRLSLVANLHDLAGESPSQLRSETLRISVPPPDTDDHLNELRVAVAQLARDIIEPRSPGPIRAPSPPAGVPRTSAGNTASQAYRFYLLGRRWLKNPGCESAGLEELLARSLDLDPSFAPAWELAARFHHRLGRTCLFGRAHLEEALTAAEQAATLDPISPSSQLLLARLQLEVGDPAGAYRLARRARQSFPHLPRAACLELRALTYLGHPQAAEEAQERCFAAAGGDLGYDGVAPETALYLGEPERFLDETRGAPSLRARYSRGQALLLAGDEAAAEAQLAPLFSVAPSQLWARLAQALLAVVQGKPQEAIQIATVLAHNATAVGLQDGEISYRIAQVLALAGDADGALDVLGTAVAQGFVCAACFQADESLRELRDHPAFGSLVLTAEQQITPLSALQD